MNYWWGPLMALAAFCGMEVMAWLTHKYLMHGFLWHVHEDHHIPKPHFFERNDWFFLVFAIPAWQCIMLGVIFQNSTSIWIGTGITLYGFAYFMLHDVYIHQRFKWLRDIDHPYFMAIRKAHKMHHKHLTKEHGECFGMLIVPRKYYKEAKATFQRKYAKT